MSDKLKKTLIAALISVALAAAVSYGLISQDTASKLETQAEQALSGDQQPAPQNAPGQVPSPGEAAPPNPAPAPQNPASRP